MAYWCAACGNPNVIVQSTKQGYSMGKGIIGTAILGPVGAVAGLDGKSTVMYYCPKCGATLNHTMPNWEVKHIQDIITQPDIYQSSIEEKHNKYPNMPMPEGWNETSSLEHTNKTTLNLKDEKDLLSKWDDLVQHSTDLDFDDKLYKFFLQNEKVPVVDLDHYSRDLWFNESYKYEIYKTSVEKSINYLKKRFKLRIEIIDHKRYYVAASNAQESEAWKLEENASNSIKVDDYDGIVKGLIRIKPRTVKEIEKELVAQFPDINKDNPYTALAAAKRACSYIDAHDNTVEFDGDFIRSKSFKETEDDIRWNIEKEWSSLSAAEASLVVQVFIPMAKSKELVTVRDIQEQLPKKVYTQKVTHALTFLRKEGCCTVNIIERVRYYSLTPKGKKSNINDLVKQLKASDLAKSCIKEDTYQDVLERLILHSGYLNIMDLPSDIRKAYEQLMILELQGFAARKEGADNYIWEYVDRGATLRKELQKEKSQLENKIREYRDANEEEISKCNNYLQNYNTLKYDKRKYELEIQKLEESKGKIQVELSSLGLFSFQQKKQLNNEIKSYNDKIFNMKNQMYDDEQAFISHNKKLKASYEYTINKYNMTISGMEKNLHDIEENLNKVNPPYLDIVLARIDRKKKRKEHLSEKNVSNIRLENEKYREEIIKIFESVQKPLTLDELFDYMGKPPIPRYRLTHILTGLMDKNKIKRNIENDIKFYSLI